MSVFISYELGGAGWAYCTIEIDGQRARISASYLSDALGDLIAAILKLFQGDTEAAVSFAEEPGEYRWRLSLKEEDRLEIRIIEFPKLWRNRLDSEGKIVLDAECYLRIFASTVLAESKRLLKIHGIEGYREKWRNHEFPVERLEKLEKFLSK